MAGQTYAQSPDLVGTDSTAAQFRTENGTARRFPTVAVAELRPHPLAVEIYGVFHEEEDSLLESIQAQGILTPLLVTTDNLVVAGGERLRVARLLGLEQVPVRVLDLDDEDEIKAKVIESNVAREKTIEQKIKEYQVLKEIESVKAAARKGTRTDLMENIPSGEARGAARDLAAAKIGWCGKTAEKGACVLDALHEQAEAGANMQEVEDVRSTLNEESVDAAHKKASELGWIAGKARTSGKARSASAARIEAVYKKAAAAAEQLVDIVKSEEIARFTPEHIRELRQKLEPLLRWITALEPASA